MGGPLVCVGTATGEKKKKKKNTTADGYDGYETAATLHCVRLVNQPTRRRTVGREPTAGQHDAATATTTTTTLHERYTT